MILASRLKGAAMRVKSKLGAVMREKGIKEGELAEKAKVRRNTVRGLMRDANTRIDLIVVEKIAAALGVRPMELFEETEDPRGPIVPRLATT
jgi:DNA-binding Xre family transcriptional regulator